MRPYYIFHCDPVIGAGHFRTSVWKGLEIMEGLRGHLSGLGVPTYVIDAPHGGGKIPLMPNYLVSMSDEVVVLRNYEGLLVRYQAEDKPSGATAPAAHTQGVSLLLQGGQTALIPQGNERMARREGGRPEQSSCGGEGTAARDGEPTKNEGQRLFPLHLVEPSLTNGHPPPSGS